MRDTATARTVFQVLDKLAERGYLKVNHPRMYIAFDEHDSVIEISPDSDIILGLHEVDPTITHMRWSNTNWRQHK